MQPGDLTTLASAKAWLDLSDTDDDVLVAALVSAASASVLNHLARAMIAAETLTEIYDVTQYDYLLLKEWPVLSVTSVQVGSATITNDASAAWPMVSGYLVSGSSRRPQKLSLVGYQFTKGKAQARVTYQAGYQATEAHTVPSAGSTLTPASTWIGDGSVSFSSSGAALAATLGAPAQGQYAVTAGVYSFNSADAGAAITLTFSSPPAPIEQAVWEIVGEAYRRQDRIGLDSKAQQGSGTVRYSALPLNHAAEMLLVPYRRVAPA